MSGENPGPELPKEGSEWSSEQFSFDDLMTRIAVELDLDKDILVKRFSDFFGRQKPNSIVNAYKSGKFVFRGLNKEKGEVVFRRLPNDDGKKGKPVHYKVNVSVQKYRNKDGDQEKRVPVFLIINMVGLNALNWSVRF